MGLTIDKYTVYNLLMQLLPCKCFQDSEPHIHSFMHKGTNQYRERKIKRPFPHHNRTCVQGMGIYAPTYRSDVHSQIGNIPYIYQQEDGTLNMV